MKPLDKQVEIKREGDIVRSVQVNSTYTEEKGGHTSVFYYRLDKELGVGADNTEALATITIEHKEPIDYVQYQQSLREDLARQGGCDISLITPMTKEEYESEKYKKEGEQL